jgi:hypothetical protein
VSLQSSAAAEMSEERWCALGPLRAFVPVYREVYDMKLCNVYLTHGVRRGKENYVICRRVWYAEECGMQKSVVCRRVWYAEECGMQKSVVCKAG